MKDYREKVRIKDHQEHLAGFKHKHISYENMSHAAITKVSWGIKMVFKSERKHPKECAADRAQMKKELISWINDIW